MDDSVDTVPAAPRKRRKRRIAGAAAVLAVAAVWMLRTPIAGNLVERQLGQRNVPAQYTIERIGPVTQRLSNIRIGDPARPDLTARWVEVDIGYGWSGPYIAGLRADGVRLYGRVVDGRLSLGALDKFRDPDSRDPFALPDMLVRLTDARARIATPWGPVGLKLNGGGNVRRDFAGQMALVAPSLHLGGCQARDVSLYGQIKIRKVEPEIIGPLRAAMISCVPGKIIAANPQVALNLKLSEDLQHWRAAADASVGRMTAGNMVAARGQFVANFAGTADRTNIKLDADMEQLAGAGIIARRAKIAGQGHLGTQSPQATGAISLTGASASADLRQQIASSGSAAQGSPIGPVIDMVTNALARALARWDGTAQFRLTGAGDDRRLEFDAPQLVAESGAKLVGGEHSYVALRLTGPQPAVTAQGLWRMSGGGMPHGNIRIDHRGNGALQGEADFAPYQAGTSRLALSGVTFSADGDGTFRFAGKAGISGPLGTGRIDDLLLPVTGVVAPGGKLAIAGGCTPVQWGQVQFGTMRIDRTALQLCSSAGLPLLAWDGGGLRGRVSIPSPVIMGHVGTSPLLMRAAHGELDLRSLHWGISDALVRVGAEANTTQFQIASVVGQPLGHGLGGTIKGAEGHIGAIPLRIGNLGGDWTWQNGLLALDGGLALTDMAVDARFQPLASKNAALRLKDGALTAMAALQERETGRQIVDVSIVHRLGDTSGHADLTVRDLRFDKGFQPADLSHLALGVIANVDGTVTGTGRVDWADGKVSSHGKFATAGTDLAAAFGPVTGASATLVFDDLLGLHSLPGQRISLAAINPGFAIIDGAVEYQLLGDNQVRIEGGSWPFAGGQLSLHPTTLDFDADQVRRLRFDLTGVDAAAFLQQFGFDNISATGIFDGTIPVVIDGLGSRIENGRLDVRSGGGSLAYVGALTNHDLGVTANFAFNALKSLKYDDLTILLNGDLDGEMVTDIRFGGVGQGAGASQNFITRQIAQIPLIFNVKISAPFRQLITSAKGFYDPSLLVEQNLPALIEAQQAKGQMGQKPSVQPSESEPRP